MVSRDKIWWANTNMILGAYKKYHENGDERRYEKYYCLTHTILEDKWWLYSSNSDEMPKLYHTTIMRLNSMLDIPKFVVSYGTRLKRLLKNELIFLYGNTKHSPSMRMVAKALIPMALEWINKKYIPRFMPSDSGNYIEIVI
jgi:hypothetical protein